MSDRTETIVLGGGCFWCTEAALASIPGVIRATPGYAGGITPDPTYEEVCRGRTGHAEVVEVEFDPGTVPLEDVLEFFFYTHDPTSPDRQGADVGTQYRSVVLYGSDEQKERVERFMERIADRYDKPIVTEVKPLVAFHPAEEYHQAYFAKNPMQPYCRMVVAPKVDKVKNKLNA
ncbi:MAG: peptide-methionine (S)-S-oxide reductase MsrA [Actinobacteria bacterium]|nr:peptide-methionine (S)-S-oxide reductase MsrA [Actinomycetota bacterium]MBU1942552.1 peptide-methionine (S)-S-oxide reductase MsrA [Actinomycetota bacterium]MBU2687203.1 peptide-methionine (S)-S-oxide reductase MsrA [Actinomycetota bacterium]